MNAALDAAGAARRRSPRLHPQVQANEEGAGLHLRRSARLHPPVHASDEGDGVTRRRSPRLHPLVQGVARRCSTRLRPKVHTNTSEEASGVIRGSCRRRHSSRAALSSPLEDDDLLREILLRLPPQTSSLPRASAVCKRWRHASTDPRFHRQFRAYHQKPPLLGFFEDSVDGIVFTPILDHPDRIPPQRFDLIDSGDLSRFQLLGCRHGRLLIMRPIQQDLIVIAPITGEECRVPIPSEFNKRYVNGAVLCAATDHDHVHGNCHLSPFKVILLSTSTYYSGPQLILASVYSSKAGVWGDVISTLTPCELPGGGTHGSLVGNALYWLCRDYMIEFDLDGHILALISAPPTINESRHFFDMREVIQIMDGAVGIAILSHYYHNIQMWQRKVNCQGATKWELWKTIDMHNIDGIPPGVEGVRTGLLFRLRYVEDTDEIFLYVGHNVYMVQLKSMQSKKLCESGCVSAHHSFKSFCMPGTTIVGGCDGSHT
ncbi:hypothetical protein CFC21_099396 [Triticum aestivum]|uniref:F-box domain-containing protein n=2 Tax=Triticum aestivum TaxID=4565 RepID=A0A3B6U853_WHEAT|nr:hypothetical protein CFC21_099396 [Triticum aestivum]